MNHIKYWGKRLRLLGDWMAGAGAAASLAATGVANGAIIVGNLPWAAVGFVVSLVFWVLMSFISREMDGGGGGD